MSKAIEGAKEFIDMTSLDDVSDDEYLDDPIILIDFEQYRFNHSSKNNGTNGEELQKIEAHIDLTDSDADVFTVSDKSTVLRKTSTTLPVTFFDIPDNVKLLNECRPLHISVVDCDKHAWYYKKHIKSVEIKNDVIVIDGDIDLCSMKNSEVESNKTQDRKVAVTPITEMSMLSKSPVNKPKIRPVDISLYMRHKKTDSIKPRMQMEEFKNREIEKQKVNHHNLNMHSEKKLEVFNDSNIVKKNGFDFKKNRGLIGVKVTYVTQLETDVVTHDNNKDKKSATVCPNVEQKSKSEINNMFQATNNNKESDTKHLNEVKQRNLTKIDRQIKKKNDQNSISLSCFPNILKKKGTLRENKNITTEENKTVEEKSDPLRFKAIRKLSFEQQDYLPKDTEYKQKQDLYTTKSGSLERKQDKIKLIIDSVHENNKKKSHKKLTTHFKETLQLFTDTKQALLKHTNTNIGEKELRTKNNDGSVKVIDQEKENNQSANPNISDNNSIGTKLDLATKTQINNTCNTIVEVHRDNKSNYRDMPCLDEVKTSNDKCNVDSEAILCKMSESTMNTYNNKKIKSKIMPKDSLNNDKQLHMKNIYSNTSQNNTVNVQLNPGAKAKNMPTTPTSTDISNNVAVCSNQSSPGVSQTNKLQTINLPQQLHMCNKNVKQENMKKINNVCKNKNLQHSSDMFANASKSIPELTGITVDNSSNSDKQNVSSSNAEDKNVKKLTVDVHAPSMISSHPNALSYLNQDNHHFRTQMSGSFASTTNTASGNKLDANILRNNTLITTPNIHKNEIQVTTSSHVHTGNTYSNTSATDKYAIMLNAGSHINMGHTLSNVSSIGHHSIMLNTGSDANIIYTQANISSNEKCAMKLNASLYGNTGHIQSNVNLIGKHAEKLNTGSNVNTGYTQSNVNSVNKHTLVFNAGSHINMDHTPSNVTSTDKHAMKLNTGSDVNIGYTQSNVNTVDKHTLMFNAGPRINMDHTPSNVNSTSKHVIKLNTGSDVNIDYTQSNVNSIDKHTMMFNASPHVNMDHTPSNVSSTGKHAMKLNTSSDVNIGYAQPNVNSIDKHTMMFNAGPHINMANTLLNVTSIDKNVMMNTDSRMSIANYQSNASSINKHAMMLNTSSHVNMGNSQSNVSPIDKLAMTVNTLNQPMQNQVAYYYQPQGLPTETVTSNMSTYYGAPPHTNSLRTMRHKNQKMQTHQHGPQNVGSYVFSRPIYNNQPHNMNLPANALPYGDTFNAYANQYNQFWNSLYSTPHAPPPSQLASGHSIQQLPLPKIAKGSTVIGQNDNGLIRTINIAAKVPKSRKSVLRNKVSPKLKSNNANHNASTVHSKFEMLEELTKALKSDVVTQNVRTPLSKADAHPNLNISLSEKYLNRSLPTICRPKPDPLSKKKKVGPSPVYYPPILEIPTYQKAFEIVTTNSSQVNYIENDKSLDKNAGFCKEHVKQNNSRKRTLSKTNHKQEKIKIKPSDEYKKQISLDEYKKRISLEEYKKRVLLYGKSDLEVKKYYDDNIENNLKCNITNKFLKEFDVRQNSDLDLGYDSDSTVKL